MSSSPYAPPYNLSSDSRLTKDFVRSSDILVDASSPSPIAPVSGRKKGDEPSALVIDENEGLVYVKPSSQSRTGWSVESVPQGKNATAVRAMTDAHGKLHVFFGADQTYHLTKSRKEDSSDSWTVKGTYTACTNLGIARVNATGMPLAYGVTGDGDLLVIRYKVASWHEGISSSPPLTLKDRSLQLQPTGTDNWVLASSGENLHLIQGSYDGNNPQFDSSREVQTQAKVTHVHFAFTYNSSTTFLFSDKNHRLLQSTGFPNQASQVGNARIQQGTGLVEYSGSMGADVSVRFYGVAPRSGEDSASARDVMVLEQTGWNQSRPEWSRAFPLDQGFQHVTVPTHGETYSSIFYVADDQSMRLLWRPEEEDAWRRSRVQRPGGDEPYTLRRYHTDITVRDVNNNAVKGAQLTVKSRKETKIFHDGSTYIIGPEDPVKLKTGPGGRLSISAPVEGLHATSLSVTGPSLDGSTTIRPSGYVGDVLAGKSNAFTGSETVGPMSSETIEKLSPDTSKKKAKAAANGIKSAVATGRTAEDPDATPHQSWTLDLGHVEDAEYRTFEDDEDYAAHLDAVDEQCDLIFGGLKKFFRNVWHSVKRGAAKVKRWTVHAGKKAANLVISIGKKTIHFKNLVLETREEAASLVHSIFKNIGVGFKKAIKWIEDVFGWDDIWHTKEVFETYFLRSLPKVADEVDHLKKEVDDKFFKTVKNKVDKFFQKGEKRVRGKTIRDLTHPTSALATANGGRLKPVKSRPGSATQQSWLLRHTLNHVPGSGSFSSLTIKIKSDLLKNLKKNLKTLKSDAKGVLNSIEDLFEDISPARRIASQGIADLFKLFRKMFDAVIDGIKTGVDVLLDALKALVKSIHETFQKKLDNIPVLTWLYKKIAPDGKAPTVAGLLSLLFAFPTTLMYKVSHNAKAPFSKKDVEKVKQRTSGSHSEAAEEANKKDPPVPTKVIQFMQFGVSWVQAMLDPIGDATVDAPIKVVDWARAVAGTMMQLLTAPFNAVVRWDWSAMRTLPKWYDWGNIILWIGWFVPTTFSVLPALPRELTETILTVSGCVLWVGSFVTIIGAVIDKKKWGQFFGAISTTTLASMPTCTAVLLTKSVRSSAEGIPWAIKMILDPVCHAGAGGLRLILSGVVTDTPRPGHYPAGLMVA